MTTTSPLTEQTPSEIDEQLGELSGQLHQRRLRWHADRKPRAAWRAETERETAERGARLVEHAEKIAELERQMRPLHDEFDRRGGWERAFHCTAHGGHVHRSMSCTTCNWDTAFTWQTWLSGKSEQQIIDVIGMTACTVCYPTAPVAQMTTEQRKAHARGEVEARKAAKAAEKAEKEAAKIPRQHALALKVNELVATFGLDSTREAYEATWGGGKFAKGYDTAYNVYSDMITRRAVVRAAVAAGPTPRLLNDLDVTVSNF